MNKKILPVIIILLLLLGVGVFAMMKKSTPSTTGNLLPTVTQQNNATGQETSQGTLKDLLSGGKSQKCIFSNNTEKTTVDGTFYISSGKIRGDIKSSSTEFNINSHMIVDSSYSYVWTDNSKQGFKFPVAEKTTSTPSQNNQSVDINQPLNYTCSGWTVDDSFFKLPSDITFQTLTVPTGSSSNPTGGSAGSTDQCSLCNNLPAGSAQDTCKSQLNCQ